MQHIYYLITSTGKRFKFYVYDCAVIFQNVYGGKIEVQKDEWYFE